MPKTLTTRDLRIKARKLGVPGFAGMDSDELREAIEEFETNGHKKSKAKKAVKKAVGKKRGRPKKVVEEDDEDEDLEEDDDEDEDEAPRRRGRPKGKTKKTAKSSKSSKSSTKKTSSKKRNSVGRPEGSGNGTRVTVPERIKWNKKFNFREGSQAQYILNTLRRYAEKYDDTADIREATIERLEKKLGDIPELTFNNRETGRPHKGEQAEKMLRYRVNRAILDFAVETDQHEGSTSSRPNKENGSATKTAKKKRGRPAKARDDEDDDFDEDEDEDEDETPKKKRGRPKGATTKTAKKRGRPAGSKNKKAKDEEKPRRGRPPGSKNKKRGPGRPAGSKNKR